MINALRERYRLKDLLGIVNMAKSSYCYVNSKLEIDKYRTERALIVKVFRDSKGRYGYRRIHYSLKNMGMVLSEKIVRRIML